MKENSIEEDIAITKKLITTKFNNDYSVDNKDKEAIEHILADYQKLLKDNKLRDKTIELMAEYIESKNLLIDKNFHVLTAESIKECFKNKAKRSDFFDQGRKESNIEIVLNLLEKLQEENEQLKNEVMEKNLEIQELLESEE